MTSQDSSTNEDYIEYECGFEPHHVHKLPADWQFGGANGRDPRADPRWKPSAYSYFDARFVCLHVTQVPFCDDEAIDRFTEVASYGAGYNPKWLQVKRSGSNVAETLPVIYDAETDEVFENV